MVTQEEREKLQKIYNTAMSGLSAQGFQRAVGEPEFCRYRAESGLKCALGHCIPDEDYDPLLDRDEAFWPVDLTNPAAIRAANTLVSAGFDRPTAFQVVAVMIWGNEPPNEIRNALVRLQAAHDEGATPQKMIYRLGHFAGEWSLQPACI